MKVFLSTILIFTGAGVSSLARWRGALILCGKRTWQQSWQQDRTCETCTQYCPAHPAWEWLTAADKAVSAGMWGLETDPGRGLLWAGREMILRDGVRRSFITKECLWGSLNHHREQMPRCWVMPKGKTYYCSPFPALAPPQHSEGPLTLAGLYWPATASLMHPPPQSADLVLWGSLWADTCGWPTQRRSWTQLSLPGLRKKKLEVSPMWLHKPCLTPATGLCQPAPYRTSKWTTRAPPVTGGAALAASGLVAGIFRGGARPESELSS